MSISQNTALFSLRGTTYGSNGVTNFALPDLQGRAAVGFGNGGRSYALQSRPDYGGRECGSGCNHFWDQHPARTRARSVLGGRGRNRFRGEVNIDGDALKAPHAAWKFALLAKQS
jgi:hypothetical protein